MLYSQAGKEHGLTGSRTPFPSSRCLRISFSFTVSTMDEFDLHLYHLLLRDPRMPLRELAERLGISLQAVHKRMQALRDAGILVGTGAAIPGIYVNATNVFVFGRMEGDRRLSDVVAGLGKNDSVGYVMLCSGNVIYVSGTLRRTVDMGEFQEFVNRTCSIKTSTMAIESLGRVGDVKPAEPLAPEIRLSPLDLRIIASLKNDARKPYAQIGEEAGVTARTVRQRLDRMMEEGSVELILKIDPTYARTISSVIHVYTREGIDRNALGIELMQRYPATVLFFRTYCNIPDMISVATNHPTMSALFEAMGALYNDPRVMNAAPNVVITAWEFDTWKEKMLPPLKRS
jgi:DNA-binding Lrp family transcriptional regulator